MKPHFNILFLVFCSHILSAQDFTFADTYPVNNLDSLERWVARNPKPTLERLKHLIALERTYYWKYSPKRTSQFDTIEKIAKSNNSIIGIASLHYLKGLFQFSHKSQSHEAIKLLLEALNGFEKIHDISGQIHCNSVLSLRNYNANSLIGDKRLADSYLSNAKLLLQQSDNPHDKLVFRLCAILLSYNTNNFKQFSKEVQVVVNLINSNPQLRYGYRKVKFTEALNYAANGKFKQSAEIYEELLKDTDAKNYDAQITYCYNLGNDYLSLKEETKGIKVYKTALAKFAESGLDYHFCIRLIYSNYRTYAQEHQDIKLANILADSLMKYEKIHNDRTNKRELVDLQSKNLLEKKEIEVAFLKKKQEALFVLISIALIFLLLITYFVVKFKIYNKKIQVLMKTQEKYYTIVAHDLRSPIENLNVLGMAIRFLIKNKRKDELEKVLNNLEQQAQSTALLINNLIEKGNITNLRINDTIELVNISELFKELYEQYKPIFDAKGIAISLDLPDNIIHKTSYKSLGIILRNLVDNAQKFTPKNGKVNIIVAQHYDTQQINIHIRNSGKGLTANQLAYFKRVLSNKLEPEIGFEGIGLGIILISKFAKKTNCAVNVNSVVDEYTEFILTLSNQKH